MESARTRKYAVSGSETLTKCKRLFRMMPTEVPCEQSTLVLLSFDEAMLTDEAGFQMEMRFVSSDPNFASKADATWLNPFTCYFYAPENPPGPVIVRVYEKGIHLGSGTLKYEAKQSERVVKMADIFLRQIRVLCDRLLQMGIPRNDLDQMLADIFASDPGSHQENLFTPYRFLNYARGVQNSALGNVDLPSLLHLAARYGFSELCSILTDLPDVYYASFTADSSGLLPEKIADENGHNQLAMLLETFRELRENFESVYVACRASMGSARSTYFHRYLTIRRFESFQTEQDEEGYQTLIQDEGCDASGAERDTYLLPINVEGNHVQDLSDEDVYINEEVYVNEEVYANECQDVNFYKKQNLHSCPNEGNNLEAEILIPHLNAEKEDSRRSRRDVVTASENSHDGGLYSSSQLQLLSFMNQVKTEQLSIDEAELLFKEWKLRYGKTSSSFRQKQAMLQVMREEIATLRSDIKKGFLRKLFGRLKNGKAEKKEGLSKTLPKQESEASPDVTEKVLPCIDILPDDSVDAFDWADATELETLRHRIGTEDVDDNYYLFTTPPQSLSVSTASDASVQSQMVYRRMQSDYQNVQDLVKMSAEPDLSSPSTPSDRLSPPTSSESPHAQHKTLGHFRNLREKLSIISFSRKWGSSSSIVDPETEVTVFKPDSKAKPDINHIYSSSLPMSSVSETLQRSGETHGGKACKKGTK